MASLSPEQIQAAREAGIVSEEARSLLAETGAGTEPLPAEDTALIGDEEAGRFVRSFSDIFIALGLLLLVVGLGMGLFSLLGEVGLLLAAGLYWLLSEYFGRRRRMSLPTLLLALSFFFALNSWLQLEFASDLIRNGNRSTGLLPSLLLLGAVGLYYWRIRLPFCFLLLGWGLVLLALAAVVELDVRHAAVFGLVAFAAGAALFALALWYDGRDPGRTRRWSDNAFWLYAVASPSMLYGLLIVGAGLIVGPRAPVSFTEFAIRSPELAPAFDALSVWAVAVIAAFTVLGLAVDRRVFVVSTLLTSGAVLLYALTRLELEGATVLSAVLVLLGAAVVILGVGWHPLRRALLKVLPGWGVFPRSA